MRAFTTVVAGFLVAALAACSVDGKEDASQLPGAAIEDEGKADSLKKPLDGGKLRVGQYAEGKFTAQRGWIAYEIDLTAGPVDVFLHGQKPGFGDPLDTILYVFGPKKANGKFPTHTLAFNDDAQPGSDVGSQLLVNVPTDGTYQIVVSSYDNWLQYPKNVERGDYKVIAKCPRDGGSDACGLAIQYEGGACFGDDACASGLHCEGEIVCAPGTQCLFVQQGTCTADYVWMSYSPKQCGTNPWQQNLLPGDEQPSYVSNEEAILVDNYFESNGVQLLEIGFLHNAVPMFQCLACVCARGDLLVVKAHAWDAARMASEHGFTALAPGDWLEQRPIQCGGNPWDEDNDRRVEETNVVSWLATENVTLRSLGFIEKTEVQYMCRACQCARGDRLFVGPASPAAGQSLRNLGFVDIIRP